MLKPADGSLTTIVDAGSVLLGLLQPYGENSLLPDAPDGEDHLPIGRIDADRDGEGISLAKSAGRSTMKPEVLLGRVRVALRLDLPGGGTSLSAEVRVDPPLFGLLASPPSCPAAGC